jgi:azurin
MPGALVPPLVTIALAALLVRGAAPVSAPVDRQQAVDTTITIRSTGSSLEFEPDEIAVKQGKRVRLRLANFGTLPHNLVLPKSEDDIDALAEAATTAAATHYVPVAMRDKMITFTPLALPGGNTVEVIFTVPPAGEYTFVCLYPGHQNTMLGTLRALR